MGARRGFCSGAELSMDIMSGAFGLVKVPALAARKEMLECQLNAGGRH